MLGIIVIKAVCSSSIDIWLICAAQSALVVSR
jgi:hypothetical protein